MIHLTRVILREIEMELKEPFRISSGSVKTKRLLLLELFDKTGLRVWSECVAKNQPNYSPETIDTSWIMLTKWIAPPILNKQWRHPSDVWPFLQKGIRGNNMAKASLEMGIWALAAEKQEKSLAAFLGGTQHELETGISIGIQDSPIQLLEKTRHALAQGYKKIKVKIKPGYDIAYIDLVRKESGSSFPLMVDANNAYTLSDNAILKKLDSFHLMMIEQPLAWDDIFQHAQLQAQLSTPICLDESITSLEKAEEMIRLKSGKIINIKPGRVGGFSSSLVIQHLCERNGIPVWCGGMLESGIGRAYNVALASLPHFTLPGDISPSSRYWEEDIVTPEWTMNEHGMMRVPFEKSGLGVTVNTKKIESMTVRKEIIE